MKQPKAMTQRRARAERCEPSNVLVEFGRQLNQSRSVGALHALLIDTAIRTCSPRRADLASNGIEAIESSERQTYDVVLMDVQMPEMDGLEASRRIAAKHKPTERPRIVAMTANAMQGDREECLAAGMDDYVTKPIRVDALVASLLQVPQRQSE